MCPSFIIDMEEKSTARLALILREEMWVGNQDSIREEKKGDFG